MPLVLLNARELASRLDISYETVLTWARRGTIPTIRDGRKRLLFNLDSVLVTLRFGVPVDSDPAEAGR